MWIKSLNNYLSWLIYCESSFWPVYPELECPELWISLLMIGLNCGPG